MYCVNNGHYPALDVNVNSDFDNVYGRIAIRRGYGGDCWRGFISAKLSKRSAISNSFADTVSVNNF